MHGDDFADTIDAPPGLEALAARLDCLTEAGLSVLTGKKVGTLKQDRYKGEGPAYVRAGSRILYPRVAVVEWLTANLSDRKQPSAKGML